MVTLQVYNTMGQPVKKLEVNVKDLGYYEMEWDGSPNDPSMPSQGLLFYRITVNGLPSELKRVIKVDHN
jgi:flagellar hook assembly protein FlgD